jgi:hypothetical protein
LSSASFTVVRSDAHTSGAPEQWNATAAFSGIVGGAAAGAGCAGASRAGAGADPAAAAVAGGSGGAATFFEAFAAAVEAAFVADAMLAGGVLFADCDSLVAAAVAAG